MTRIGVQRIGRPASLPRAGLLPLLFICLAFVGCQGTVDDHGEMADDGVSGLGLDPGTELHRVTLGGRGSEEHAVPTLIRASPGDAVEFRTVDHRVHSLSFSGDSLTPEVDAYLEATGQTASPPLVSRGSIFLLRLQGAPPGEYLFVTDGHGGIARGVIEVGPLPGTDSPGAPGD